MAKDTHFKLYFQFRFLCLCGSDNLNDTPTRNYIRWKFVICILIFILFYYNFSVYFKKSGNYIIRKTAKQGTKGFITYRWFMANKYRFKNLGDSETPKYAKGTPYCKLNLTSLGPSQVNKTKLELRWVEQQFPYIQAGGFYVPTHCLSRHRVAILVPYRNRETNLAIFLYHIHPFLRKQLIEYRIFVIEQNGYDQFNKGALYNIGFLESQRFGSWRCIIFHDVDLLPLDERILYSCPRKPTHMSSAVESFGFRLPYLKIFGGVTVLTPTQYDTVNGYSNHYWNWGAEDDDMFVRLQSKRYPVLRYNKSIGRYATLPHIPNEINDKRHYLLSYAKRRFWEEGLRSLKYKLVNVTKRRLFTHIVADIDPHDYEIYYNN